MKRLWRESGEANVQYPQARQNNQKATQLLPKCNKSPTPETDQCSVGASRRARRLSFFVGKGAPKSKARTLLRNFARDISSPRLRGIVRKAGGAPTRFS